MEQASSAAALALESTLPPGLPAEQLLDGLPMGVLVLTASGQVRYLNPEAAALCGVPAAEVRGKLVATLSPTPLPAALSQAIQAVLAGADTGAEEYFLPHSQQWITQRSTQYPGYVVMYWQNATAHHQADTVLSENELRQAFLVQLGDTLRPLTTTHAILTVTCEALGQFLDVTAVGYNLVAADENTILASGEYSNGRIPSLTDYRFHMSDYGPVLRAGHDVYTEDALAMPGSSSEPAAAQASVAVPLHKRGRLVAWLYVAHSQPRQWPLAERRLLRAVAERTWAAVERAGAVEALRESEERYRTLFESIDEGYFLCDVLFDAHDAPMDIYYLDANPAATRMVGSDYRGRHLREINPNYEAAWYEIFGRVAKTGVGERLERYAAPDKLWYNFYVFKIGGPESRRIAVIFLNTTERKRADAQLAALTASLEQQVAARTYDLQTSKDLQEAVFNTIRHGITVLQAIRNEQGKVTDFSIILSNGVAERYLGRRAAGTTLRTAGSIDEAHFQLMVATVETCQPAETTWHLTDGNLPRYLHTQYHILADGVVLVQEDITERKLIELTLKGSKELLQSVYDTSLIGMSVLRAVRDATGAIQDFTIVSVNRELERETGRTDLVGKNFVQEYPGIITSGLFDLMLRAMATSEPQRTEYFYPYDGFQEWYSCVFVKLDDGLVSTYLNITERKQAEEEQQKQLTLLQQSEAVAQLGSWDYELATGALRWSAGMYHLFGLPPGSPVSLSMYLNFAVEEDRSIAQRLVDNLSQGQADFAGTLRILVGTEVKTMRIKAEVLRDEQQPTRVLGVDLDISEVQRLEAENLHMRLTQQQARIAAVLEAQEEERRRLAESLHNGLGQVLYATKLQLDQLTAAPQLAGSPALAAARQEADRLLMEAIRQVRAVSHELTPTILAEFGLQAALQDICHSLSSPQLRWQCVVSLDEALPVPMPLQAAVYRLAQELTQNVVKHAKAKLATLEIDTLPGWLVMRVEDDGRGFEPAAHTDGIGLKTLHHRVALLGGTARLDSAAGGSQVQIRLPLPAALPLLADNT
jgi:signal transduction histidine kinase